MHVCIGLQLDFQNRYTVNDIIEASKNSVFDFSTNQNKSLKLSASYKESTDEFYRS
jgi:hypothetical protein